MHSPDEASVDDRGGATEGGASSSAPGEEQAKARNGDYSRQSRKRSSKELSVKEKLSHTNRAKLSQTKWRCRYETETSNEDEGKDSNDRGREKDKARSSSASKEHSNGSKDTSSGGSGSSES